MVETIAIAVLLGDKKGVSQVLECTERGQTDEFGRGHLKGPI